MRWLWPAISSLLFGAVITVLIAWGLVLWGPLYEGRSWRHPTEPPRQLPVKVPQEWVTASGPSAWQYYESLGPGVAYGECRMVAYAASSGSRGSFLPTPTTNASMF